ncbi:MAG: hypothetical protein WC634_02145 [archaeon]
MPILFGKRMKLPGFLRRGWFNPFNRRKQKSERRPGGFVAVPAGGAKQVIKDRRKKRRLVP